MNSTCWLQNELKLISEELDRGRVISGVLNITDVEREGVCRVFSSTMGISVEAERLRQQVETRLWLAQKFLVFQHLRHGSWH